MIRYSPDGNRKTCNDCDRWMSANDEHRRCQPCRGSAEASRRYRTRLWARQQLGRPLPEGWR